MLDLKNFLLMVFSPYLSVYVGKSQSPVITRHLHTMADLCFVTATKLHKAGNFTEEKVQNSINNSTFVSTFDSYKGE